MNARIRARVRRIRARLRVVRFARNERGIQLVELAFVLPIFLMLFGATAEFGRFFYEYTTLAKGARAGSRYLVTAPVNDAEDTIARNIVVYGNAAGTGSPIVNGLTTANVTITREGGVSALPETVKVQITGYQYQPIFDLGKIVKSNTLSMSIDVKPSVTMRYLLTQPLV